MKWSTALTVIFAIFMITNIVFIDYVLYKQSAKSKDTSLNDLSLHVPTISGTDSRFSDDPLVVPEFVEAQDLKNATASLAQKVNVLEQRVFNGSPLPSATFASPTSSPGTANNAVHEYYIPLGSGSSSSTAWESLTGIEAYVAPLNYGTITGMYFEASIRVPTGNGTVYARLLNSTDNVSLIESEVQSTSNTGQMISSTKLPVSSSTKLYRVQLKSSLGAQVVLDNARIKIFAR
ncbi:hypothetical protein C4564_02155 [Candidatus Microgenomates bacterium]|nr:MAG: hypothetical protein C4564_02155 [Candidatus Microgenomates bacterium]